MFDYQRPIKPGFFIYPVSPGRSWDRWCLANNKWHMWKIKSNILAPPVLFPKWIQSWMDFGFDQLVFISFLWDTRQDRGNTCFCWEEHLQFSAKTEKHNATVVLRDQLWIYRRGASETLGKPNSRSSHTTSLNTAKYIWNMLKQCSDTIVDSFGHTGMLRNNSKVEGSHSGNDSPQNPNNPLGTLLAELDCSPIRNPLETH